jgi:hypothetical protein
MVNGHSMIDASLKICQALRNEIERLEKENQMLRDTINEEWYSKLHSQHHKLLVKKD